MSVFGDRNGLNKNLLYYCYYYLTADCGTSALCVNYSQANKGNKPAKISQSSPFFCKTVVVVRVAIRAATLVSNVPSLPSPLLGGAGMAQW